jgi:hypothetical protein
VQRGFARELCSLGEIQSYLARAATAGGSGGFSHSVKESINDRLTVSKATLSCREIEVGHER